MIIYLVGNPSQPEDNTPVRLHKLLKEKFPALTFREIDPSETFIPETDSILLDTVKGLGKVTLFDSLDTFESSHRTVGAHDYDLLLHLKILMKLEKIRKVHIIGVPQNMSFQSAYNQVQKLLRAMS